MRLYHLLIIGLTSALAACGVNDEDRQSAEEAVDEASLAIQTQLISSSLADIAATTPTAASAVERAQALATGAGKLLDCGLVEAEGSIVRIAFDGLGCLVRNQRLWGEVLIDVTEMPTLAHLTFLEVTDGGLTIEGESSVDFTQETRRINEDVSLSLNESSTTTYLYIDQRNESPSTEGLLITSGTRCITSSNASVSCTLSSTGSPECSESEGDCIEVRSEDLTLQWNLDVPVAGELGAHRVTLANHTREVSLAYLFEHDEEGSESGAFGGKLLINAQVSHLSRPRSSARESAQDESAWISEVSNSFDFIIEFP